MAARPMADNATGEASIGTLVNSIKEDLTTLIRGEMELAKAEMRESAKQGGVGGALLGAAGYMAVLASVLLSIAAGYGLTALDLHPGWAFLIVGGTYLLVAALLGLIARSRLTSVHGPEGAKRMATRIVLALRPRRRPPA